MRNFINMLCEFYDQEGSYGGGGSGPETNLVVWNIDWDTEGERPYSELPISCELFIGDDEIDEHTEEWQAKHIIADKLSEKYGSAVNDFYFRFE